jgi:hypothetical protein
MFQTCNGNSGAFVCILHILVVKTHTKSIHYDLIIIIIIFLNALLALIFQQQLLNKQQPNTGVGV